MHRDGGDGGGSSSGDWRSARILCIAMNAVDSLFVVGWFSVFFLLLSFFLQFVWFELIQSRSVLFAFAGALDLCLLRQRATVCVHTVFPCCFHSLVSEFIV